MTKFSNFIRNLGTAGPATLQGIYDLGFALRSEIPALFNKYLRVDASQSFTGPEKLQGRDNLGLGTIATQAANAVTLSGGSIAGITDLAIADGGTGASTAPAARTALGLGNVDNTADTAKPVSTAQQTALNLKAPLASPALTGTPTVPTAAPGTNTTQAASTAFVAAAVGAAPISKEYVSAEQAFVTSSAIVFTHGLGVTPKIIIAELVCKTTEGGYSVGTVIEIATSQQATSLTDVYGASFLKSSTQIQVFFGSGGTFVILSTITFSGLAITPANWRLVVRAYA